MAGRSYAVARDSTSSIPASRSAGSPTPHEERPLSLNRPPSSTGRSSGISPSTRSARSSARNEYGDPTSKYSTAPIGEGYRERRPPGFAAGSARSARPPEHGQRAGAVQGVVHRGVRPARRISG